MNKGMFYCLPFLALTQVAASNALPHLEVASLFNKTESTSVKTEAPKPNVANPISGRNANVGPMIKIFKPRAGRNARLLKGRNLKLIKRR
jgi:hypothetical protein